MSEPELCIFQQQYCNECPPMWDPIESKCKHYAVVNILYFGQQPIDTTGSPPASPLTPVVQGMTGVPDVSTIPWTVGKGDQKYEARPEDRSAWAFVYKYDHDTRASTKDVRDDCYQLVSYLRAHENKLISDGYSYSISKNDMFLNRNKLS